jgi:hypothetical protein
MTLSKKPTTPHRAGLWSAFETHLAEPGANEMGDHWQSKEAVVILLVFGRVASRRVRRALGRSW